MSEREAETQPSAGQVRRSLMAENKASNAPKRIDSSSEKAADKQQPLNTSHVKRSGKTSQLNVRVDSAIHMEASIKAKRQGRTLAEVVESYLASYLAENKEH